MGTVSIELDCQPGIPRPGDLIGGVVKGLELTVGDPVSMFFGNWRWEFVDVSDEQWNKIKPTIEERITNLYEHSVIRYGSWSTLATVAQDGGEAYGRKRSGL